MIERSSSEKVNADFWNVSNQEEYLKIRGYLLEKSFLIYSLDNADPRFKLFRNKFNRLDNMFDCGIFFTNRTKFNTNRTFSKKELDKANRILQSIRDLLLIIRIEQ
jgi:Ulp1 family protease